MANPSRAYMLVAGDFVPTGGMDRANLALAQHLANLGDPVHLVTHRADKALSASHNVTTHLVPRPLRSYLLGAPLLDRTGRKLSKEKRFRPLTCLINGGNCMVSGVNWVHYLHHAYQPTSSGNPLRRIKTSIFHHQGMRDECAALKIADAVIANSDRTKQHICDHIGIPKDRVHTVYYGIDPALYAPVTLHRRLTIRASLGLDTKRPVVIFVGALGDHRKGFDTLFGAWKALCSDKAWDADLLVIGTGSSLTYWKKEAQLAGFGSRMRFLGFRADVPSILSACDVMVAPTRYEAFGLGVLEALCLSIPALVSASAGVAERYPSEAAYMLLQDPDSVDELTGKLRNWQAHSQFFKHDAENISQSLRMHTWTDMSRQIAHIMHQIQ